MHRQSFHKSPAGIVLAMVVVLAGSFFVRGTHLFAATSSELQSKINETSAQIEALNKEIASYQSQLVTIGKQADTLANQVKELDTTRNEVLTNIKLTEAKISKAELDLQTLGGQIEDKEATISERSLLIEKNIRLLHEAGDMSLLELMLSNKSFADTWTSLDNARSFENAIRDNVHELTQAKSVLIDRETDVQKKKNELLTLRSSLTDQKKILDQNVKEKNDLLTATKNQESSYQKIVADRQALVAAFEAEQRSYEEQLHYTFHPGDLPPAGSAPLSWPLDDPFITQMFGKTVDSIRLYASGSHSGTDFRAALGTPIYAMADGTVGGTGDTDVACRGASFGKWILVRFNNNLAATYGHLSLIKVSNGQTVKRGELIGYSGATGHVTGPHLHVSMYPSDAVSVAPLPSIACTGKILTQPRAAVTAYLDPLAYMPKTTPSMFK